MGSRSRATTPTGSRRLTAQAYTLRDRWPARTSHSMQMRRHVSTILYAVALVAGYTALVVWLTWPLAAFVGTTLPTVGFAPFACFFDLYYSVWALAHESHTLVSTPTLFAHANIYHPTPAALFYGPAAIGALPLFAPFFLATSNPALAINVTFLLGIALTGAAMHVVVRRWTGSELAGIVGATTVVANQWLVWGFVPSAPHWAALYCLPLIAFMAATRLENFSAALVLVPLVALQCLTDLVYVTPAVMGPLGALAGFHLLRRHTRAAGFRLIGVLALAALILVPVYRGYATVRAANPDLAQQTKWTTTGASFPTPLPERLLHGGEPFLLTPVAMGLVVLGIAALAWRRRSGATPATPGGWAHGALWAVVGGCLALNPVVLIGGTAFVTPLAYLAQWIPALNVIRVPGRLGVAGLIGLGILSGVAFGEIAQVIRVLVRRNSIALGWTVVMALLVVRLTYDAYVDNYWTFTGPAEMPSAYGLQPVPGIPTTLLPVLESSRAPLIELPIGADGIDPRLHALAMFHSIQHRRPILNGYSSYWPAGFVERMAEANRLPERDALDHLVDTTGLSLIWLHTQWLTAEQNAAWASLPSRSVGQHGLTLIAREGPEVLFAVTPTPTVAAE